MDRIDPEGSDALDNLALACWNCNNHKRQSTEVPDPESNQVVRLYHPRQQSWDEHFRWSDDFVYIVGLTATGRATIERLKMNRVSILHARERWVAAGYHPPTDDSTE